ncbi:hypothetical protein [Luteipulveratus mongoliensis]|uniref:hypothetical protein n=1 Tax=Luteipulveratus mongoliensis TaxID=571913 RepID=UPI0009FA64F4|nr:hypothetical protein [Luteipulveratus mongoliensis]
MSDSTWALTGVVVGAILGGLAQIMAGVLTDRRAHQRWVRERRADVYRDLLVAVDHHAQFVMRSEWEGNREPIPEDYGQSVESPQADVELFGSKPVTDAGRTLVGTVQGWGFKSPNWTTYDAARNEYQRAARDDLGTHKGRSTVRRRRASGGVDRRKTPATNTAQASDLVKRS